MQCNNRYYNISSPQILCTLSACLQDRNAAARLYCAMLDFKDDAPKGCALILFAKSLQTSGKALAPLLSLLITPVAPMGPCRLLA